MSFESKNKPLKPAPPLNALKNPEVRREEPKEHRSVYDEIAERRKREKHKIGVTPPERRDEAETVSKDELEEVLEERREKREEDVKVYVPDKKPRKKLKAVKIDDDYSQENENPSETETIPEVEEANLDVLAVLQKPRKTKNLSLWIAIIASLSALCVLVLIMYGYINGWFSGMIGLL